MKPYTSYKPSGIEWIGDIPSHWDRTKLKHLVEIRITDGPHETPEFIPEGIPFLSAESIKINRLDFNARRGNISRELFEQYNIKSEVKRNDILFCKSGSTTGKSAMVETDDEFAIWSPLAIIRADRKKVFQKFLYHYIQSREFQTQVQTFWSFGTQPNIGMSTLENLYVAFPIEIDEQTAIASFLDEKTAQIDKLVANKQQLIELLKEERTAIINDAVSGKGKNWEKKKLKYLLKEVKGALKPGPFGSDLKNSDVSLVGPIKVYTQRNVIDDDFETGEDFISEEKFKSLSVFEIFENEILVTTRGTIGKTAIFPKNAARGIIHPCLIKMQIDNNKVLNEWLIIFFNESSFFQENVKLNSNSTIIDVIYGYTLREVIIPVPPLKEQTTIVHYIQTETQRIDTAISKVEQEIELMQEYRTALISEVVTGKVDVRNQQQKPLKKNQVSEAL